MPHSPEDKKKALTRVRRICGQAEVLERAAAAVGALEPADGPARGNGPARYYCVPGAAGTIGVITPMSHTYCDTCNRVRLTADGRLRTCLYGDHEVNLRDPLRAGCGIVDEERHLAGRGILADVVEEKFAEAVEGDALHEARRDDAVGIDVVAGDEHAAAGDGGDFCESHERES